MALTNYLKWKAILMRTRGIDEATDCNCDAIRSLKSGGIVSFGNGCRAEHSLSLSPVYQKTQYASNQ